MGQEFLIILIDGVPVREAVLSGDVDTGRKIIERDVEKTPGMSIQRFTSDSDPEYQRLIKQLPSPIPDLQEQINAVFQGGQAFEAMKVKVLGPSVPVRREKNG